MILLLFIPLLMISRCIYADITYPADFRNSDHLHARTAVRHIEKGGIGYDKGYTTIEAFLAPDPKTIEVMPFMDLRSHVFNDGKLAANVGIGFRKAVECRAYGLNVYYDFREVQNTHYQQMGVGFETLGKRWDLRINGYVPFDDEIIKPCPARFIGFSGHHLILSQNYRFAMKGGNAEFGVHFGKTKDFEFYATAGTYVFQGDVGPRIWGGKARLLAQYRKYITFELSNSYDKMFRNRFQGQLTFTLPFGSGSDVRNTEIYDTCDKPDLIFYRMTQPVDRQEIIVEGFCKQKSAAIDPNTCKPYYFVFVDNTSSSRGTFESPYPSLFAAQSSSKLGDIIYVFPGDGTTKGMDAGIILKQNQKFWGSGVSHPLQTAQGTILIPALTSTSPQITNTLGSGVTLASVNEVSGINIINAFDYGIYGTNGKNIAISDCTINNSQLDHINLGYSGTSGIATFNRLVLTNAQFTGIVINSTSSSMSCSINKCVIQDNGAQAVDTTFTGVAHVNFLNTITERNFGTSGFVFNGPATFHATGNTLNSGNSVSSAPLIITAGAQSISATIEDNTISNNTCGGIQFILNDTASAQLNVSRNIMNNNASGTIASFGTPIFVNANGTTQGNCFLNITENTVTESQVAGLFCANGGFNNFQANIVNNTFDSNGAGLVFFNDMNSFSLNASNNLITNNGDHGITTPANSITAANMNITNNQITGNTNQASGIALSHSGNNLNLVVANNTISDNETSGIIMYAGTAIDNVTLQIENNTINNNQNLGSNASGGIDIEQYENLSGTILNNSLLNNVPSGLYVESLEPAPAVCLTLSGNSSDNGYILSNPSGTFNLAPCDADSVNSGVITRNGVIDSVQSCPDAIPC